MEIKPFAFKELYGQREYNRIITMASDPDAKNNLSNWDYFYYAQSLYKKERYKDCIDCYKECKKKYPDFTYINNIMCWSVYHDKVKPFNMETQDKNELFKIVDYAIGQCKQEKYSAYELIISKALRIIFSNRANNAINYKLGDHYLSLIEPSLLSKEEQIRVIDGKERRVSSERERWYTRKTKALEKLGNYKECIQLIDKAFNDINRFHNNNNHWLMYRKAICHYEQGDLDSGESIIKEVLTAFSHWTFYGLLFKIYRDKGNQDLALQYSAMAASYDRDHKLRVTLYGELAEYLNTLGKYEESELHIKLIELIRKEEGWSEDKCFKNYIISDHINNLTKNQVMNDLNSLWQDYKYANQTFIKGEVAKVFVNGKSGLIYDNNNKSYYFRLGDFIKRTDRVLTGQKVEFIATERLDKKNNQLKPNAIDIRIR